MNNDDKVAKILSELTARFPGGNKYDLQDVSGYFKDLASEDIDMVYQCIVRNHEYNTFPKLVKIKKYVEHDNLPIVKKELRKERIYEYYVCQVCKAKFDTEIGWCPLCKKSTEVKVLLSRQKIDTAFYGRQGCAKCDKYNTRNICTTCDSYGNPFSCGDMCRDCQGLDCCKEYKELRKKGLP